MASETETSFERWFYEKYIYIHEYIVLYYIMLFVYTDVHVLEVFQFIFFVDCDFITSFFEFMMLNLTKNLKICWEIHLQAALLNIILSGEKLQITDHHYIHIYEYLYNHTNILL